MFTLRLKWLLLEPVLRVDFRSCEKSENRDSGGLCMEVRGCRRPAPQPTPGPMRLPLSLRGHCLLSCPRALGPQVPSPTTLWPVWLWKHLHRVIVFGLLL